LLGWYSWKRMCPVQKISLDEKLIKAVYLTIWWFRELRQCSQREYWRNNNFFFFFASKMCLEVYIHSPSCGKFIYKNVMWRKYRQHSNFVLKGYNFDIKHAWRKLIILKPRLDFHAKWQFVLSNSDYIRICSCCFRTELILFSSDSPIETKLNFSRIQKVEWRDFGLILGQGYQTYGTRAHSDNWIESA
jgi:hypothetical protein